MAENETDNDLGRQLKSVLDNLVSNFRDWMSIAAEKAGELTRVAAEKAEEFGKLGKLKMDIYQLQRERQKALSALGLLTFKALNKKTVSDWEKSGSVSELIARVTALDKEIAVKDAVKDTEATADAEQTAPAEPSKNGNKEKSAAEPKKTTVKKTTAKKSAAKATKPGTSGKKSG